MIGFFYMQEILVVIAVGLAVLFIPRLMNRNASSQSRSASGVRSNSPIQRISQAFKAGLPGWIRLLIVLSFFWIAGCAVYLKPWERNLFLFLCIGLGPVLALWGGIWVWAGYVKYRR